MGGTATGVRRSWVTGIASLICMAWLVSGPSAGCGAPTTSDRNLTFISTDDAEALVGRRRGILGLGGEKRTAWVDPRSELSFRQGHIPGAIHMPFARVREDHEILRGYDVVIVYGDEFRDPVAEGMSKRLMELGHRDVRTLRGGLRAWTDSGRSVEQAE